MGRRGFGGYESGEQGLACGMYTLAVADAIALLPAVSRSHSAR